MVWDNQGQHEGANCNDLSEMDLEIIGRAKRISVPLGEPLLMRQVADILRTLAMHLDMSSRRTDLPERSRRMHDRFEVDCANRKIKEAAAMFGQEIREGRPAAEH